MRKKILVTVDANVPPNWNPYQFFQTPANAILPMLDRIKQQALFD
jgi:hypothetical protein